MERYRATATNTLQINASRRMNIGNLWWIQKKKKGSGRRMSLYHPTYVKLKNSTTISGNMSYKWKL